SSRRRHTRCLSDWSSDVCSSDLIRAHVRVADEQMQSPIFPVIGQRLVAGVNNGAIELHPLINVVDDVIGALAQLKIHLALWLGRSEERRVGKEERTGRSRVAGNN